MNEINNTNLIPPNPAIDINSLRPFNKFCVSIGMLPTSYKTSLTYEEQLLWLCNYLENTVIPAVNNNGEAIAELQGLYIQLKNYVDDYFTNLDVQEEINNKLDQMAEDGTLEEIITAYINIKGMLAFNNVSEMKQATNLVNGSFAQTFGFYNVNDGGNAKYKIRTITNEDVVDEMFIIALNDDNLIAELIIENEEINLKKIGAKGDNTDDTNYFKAALLKGINIYIPNGVYKISETLTIPNLPITINGAGCDRNTTNGTVLKLITPNISLFSLSGYCSKTFSNFSIKNESNGNDEQAFISTTSIGFIKHENLQIDGFEHAFKYHRTLYMTFNKINCNNCDYGIDCWQYTGTPPLILNSNEENGYYNNVISITNCQIINCITGYRLVGACIKLYNCDCSSYSGTAFVFGGNDFSTGGNLSLDEIYTENGTTTAIEINNMMTTIGTVFLGGTENIGIDIKNNSRVVIDNIKSYGGRTTTTIKNNNSKVFVTGYFRGDTGPITDENNGFTYVIDNYKNQFKLININQNENDIISTGSTNDVFYACDLFGILNGTTPFELRLMQRGNRVWVLGELPSTLEITSVINQNGTYDIKLNNIATYAYNINVRAVYNRAY